MQKQMEQANQRSENYYDTSSELKRLRQELVEFTYAVSHDLKEPLRKILTYGNFLMEDYGDKLDKEGSGYIGRMQDAAERMKVMIEALLELSCVGRASRALKIINSLTLVDDVLRLLGFSRHMGIEFQYSDEHENQVILGDLSDVRADVEQFRLVFHHIILNGLKYQPMGKPAHLMIDSVDDGEWITFSVKDDGIGIDAQHRTRIFNVFQRLHSRLEYGGSGVGLALCKKIVEMHGGQIWCESEPGNGSTFYFTLKSA
ncbi:hypothetical protein JW960_11085 [candidate division KSB1 bacterium]|nr:hypothetical protein [candidate division KSB1 bacterium]